MQKRLQQHRQSMLSAVVRGHPPTCCSTSAGKVTSEPFVQITTDQFARWRLAEVTRERCVVEFESPPPAGENNVTIWWLAVR